MLACQAQVSTKGFFFLEAPTGHPAIFGWILWLGVARESASAKGVSSPERSGLPELTEVKEAANSGHGSVLRGWELC